MDTQSYSIELMHPSPEKFEIFNEKLLPMIVRTITELNMITAEQFSNEEEMFIEVLREVFMLMFSDSVDVKFNGKFHPPTDVLGPRYDLGLVIGKGDEAMYPIQVILVGKPTEFITVH